MAPRIASLKRVASFIGTAGTRVAAAKRLLRPEAEPTKVASAETGTTSNEERATLAYKMRQAAAMKRRDARDIQLMCDLLNSKTAEHKCRDWALIPTVEHADNIEPAPVRTHREVHVRDVVYCKVEPSKEL